MPDLPDPPDGSSNDPPKFEEALRRFLKAQGISEAAIAELLKGHPIMSTGAQEIFPGFVIPGEEKVYKDGKLQDIKPSEPAGTIHLEDSTEPTN
ncbi:hypothetical protein A2V54_03075 [candidate division WWE3 bacterium RBG_19FT_COMBO_53_11]|uniref:Uncharacterized protein n=1 Tax=candidate division WWE3 bacterium RBG_19FT_COMBO_53_11 TaxID=1802613 RepID=A0A1F4UH99_UNCKA|nr:MAG: hypothetical protein A2155_02635 [candidate division WWE3 bacterium RBG_16_52_45]OGC44338.1 MAG: hypothetical protein A2V54_03075 [candidate division WWE3 bacterium RBG_19FT_COMBO_53_11]